MSVFMLNLQLIDLQTDTNVFFRSDMILGLALEEGNTQTVSSFS